MRYILILILYIPCLCFAQGKFFGGDSPVSYGGGSLLIVTLGVDYVSFNASSSENSILITWSTTSELNNDFFEIQQLEENEEFVGLTTIIGNGITTQNVVYSYEDRSPLLGVNYYRIRQVDFDGTTDISKTISATYLPTKPTVYPNPATDRLYLSNVPNNATINVFSIDGQLVKTNLLESTLYIDGLTNGQYIIKIDIGSEVINLRFIKQ